MLAPAEGALVGMGSAGSKGKKSQLEKKHFILAWERKPRAGSASPLSQPRTWSTRVSPPGPGRYWEELHGECLHSTDWTRPQWQCWAS